MKKITISVPDEFLDKLAQYCYYTSRTKSGALVYAFLKEWNQFCDDVVSTNSLEDLHRYYDEKGHDVL